MRAALLLPLLARLADARACKAQSSLSPSSSPPFTPETTPSYYEPVTTTSTSSTEAPTTTSIPVSDTTSSGPVLSSSSADSIILTTSSEIPTTSSETPTASTTAPDDVTTSSTPEPTTTTTSSSSSTETPSSTTSPLLPLVTNFCIKATTPTTRNFDYHLSFTSPEGNIIFSSPTVDSFSFFDFDPNSGNLTIHDGTYRGYQVQAPPPFNMQTTRVLRAAQAPLAASASPLLCTSPSGLYTSGSRLQCQTSGLWSSGATVVYDRFVMSASASTGNVPWQVRMQEYTGSTYVDYGIALFFGSHCALTPPAP